MNDLPAMPAPRNTFAALRQFARPRAAARERCELCSAELSSEHPHLLELATRQLHCACDACALLFNGGASGRYRQVPRRIEFWPDLILADAQWEALGIPIALAFFFRSSSQNRIVTMYPSPGGATEATVPHFGIRGLDLVYALLDGCDLAILIDAVPREGNPPGTLFLLEPRLDAPGESPPLVEGHSMDAVKVLHTAIAMGAQVNRVLIVGCQPGACEPLDEAGLDAPMEMIAAVRGAIDEAVQMVESLIHQPLSALHSAQPSMEVSP